MTAALRNYGFTKEAHQEASRCVECGHCESVCPQHIDIMKQMKKAKALYEG
jgi:predicted aldo/keto reductase-like oxidoreductase